MDGPRGPGVSSRVMRPARALGLVLVGTALLYAPGLATGFLSDDYAVLGHLARRGLGRVWTASFLELQGVLFYRPLLVTSYALDRAVYDLDPWGFHLTNLLLHLLVTLLVYVLGRALTRDVRSGVLAAALHGLNPLGPNAVTWVAGRVSLLVSFFGLLGVAAALRHRRRPGRLPAAAAGAGLLLGLLAKEAAAGLPLFLLVLDRLLPPPRFRRRFHLGLWGVLGAYLLLRTLVLGRLVGGYAWEEASWGGAVGSLGASLPVLLLPLLAAVGGGGVLRLLGGGMLFVLGLLWLRRPQGTGRAAVLFLLWTAGMTAAIYPAWEVARENAERWYPALLGGALLLAAGLGALGRGGRVLGWGLVLVGLPFLHRGVADYRRAGLRARALRAAVLGAPGRGAVFVYHLPLTVRGAPFFHWGLADACAPPFAPRRREVFPVLAPHTFVDAAVLPAAWAAAAGEEAALLWCSEGGEVLFRGAGPALRARREWAPWRAAVRIPVQVTGETVRVPAPRGSRVVLFLCAPAGSRRWEGPGGAALSLAPVQDHLRYPGMRRGLLVAVVLREGRIRGWGWRWLRRR